MKPKAVIPRQFKSYISITWVFFRNYAYSSLYVGKPEQPIVASFQFFLYADTSKILITCSRKKIIGGSWH